MQSSILKRHSILLRYGQCWYTRTNDSIRIHTQKDLWKDHQNNGPIAYTNWRQLAALDLSREIYASYVKIYVSIAQWVSFIEITDECLNKYLCKIEERSPNFDHLISPEPIVLRMSLNILVIFVEKVEI